MARCGEKKTMPLLLSKQKQNYYWKEVLGGTLSTLFQTLRLILARRNLYERAKIEKHKTALVAPPTSIYSITFILPSCTYHTPTFSAPVPTLFFCFPFFPRTAGVSRPGLLEQRLRGDPPPGPPEGQPVQGQLRPVQGDGSPKAEAAGVCVCVRVLGVCLFVDGWVGVCRGVLSGVCTCTCC